jgi:YhcN/YlaJ family sporulation lipoprotein
MFTKLIKITGLLMISIMVFVAGCGNNARSAKNQVKQQGTHMQQAPEKIQMKMANRFDIAQAAADRIVRLNGVKGANVLVTKPNAYVAAVVNTPANQLPRALEDRIANEVRATDPTIKNVYVSTNPEFVDRVNQYAEYVRQGRPVSGFFNELSQMIQRIFPVAR